MAEVIVVRLTGGAQQAEDPVHREEPEQRVDGSEQNCALLIGPAEERAIVGVVRGRGGPGGRGDAPSGPALDDDIGAAAPGEEDVEDQGVHDGAMVIGGRGVVIEGEVEPPVVFGGGGAGGGVVEAGDAGGDDGVEGFVEEPGDDLPIGFGRRRHEEGTATAFQAKIRSSGRGPAVKIRSSGNGAAAGGQRQEDRIIIAILVTGGGEEEERRR